MIAGTPQPLAIDPAPYLRVPYRAQGRDQDGWDCWGLVLVAFAREAGIVLPAWDTVPSDPCAARDDAMAAEAARPIWRRLSSDEPHRPLDVLLFARSGDGSGRLDHCGVVLSPGFFLHACEGRGTLVDPYAREKDRRGTIWGRVLVSVHRHVDLDALRRTDSAA